MKIMFGLFPYRLQSVRSKFCDAVGVISYAHDVC